MPFEALEVSLDLAAALREPLDRLRHRDRDLHGQARRAASSIALNLAEGRRRAGQDRIQLFRVALGSAGELRAALRLAVAWGHLDGAALEPALALLDRVLAMSYRLAHGGRRR